MPRRSRQCFNSVKLSTHLIEPRSLPRDFGTQPIEPNALPGESGALLNQLETVLRERRLQQRHQRIEPRLHDRLEFACPIIQNAHHLFQGIQDRTPKNLVLRADCALFGQDRPKLPANSIETDHVAHEPPKQVASRRSYPIIHPARIDPEPARSGLQIPRESR
jgi:hypothetical protein